MPERFTPPSGDAYSVGGWPPTKHVGPALSSDVVTPAALLPERFLGGCAFGGCGWLQLSPAGIYRHDRL